MATSMTENGITRVKFSLWAVLAFLVLLVGMGGGYLFNTQAADRERIQNNREEIIVLKQQYIQIETKLNDISQTLKEIARKR